MPSSSSLKEELGIVRLKAQSIAVDAVLSAQAKLMEGYKRGEHVNWDPDQEIETWKKREVVLVAGKDASDEAEDEEEATPAVGSLKPVKMGVDPKQAEPDVGAKEVVLEPTEMAASAEDIAGD